MTTKKLHPSIADFKEFISSRPHLIISVRKGEYTWQELYEEWYLLGAEDPRWDSGSDGEKGQQKSEEKGSKHWVNQITDIVKNMDIDQVQSHIGQLSQAIGALQGVIGQFQNEEKTTNSTNQAGPFSFRKD